jgi:hypothetical protein|tara:strand:- start:147 stop:389 length:243 start_codon:yes stop_codon:yes gene_type:complete
MKTYLLQDIEEVVLRVDDNNPNHHLWNNNGTWWIHYTVYPSPVTAERRRSSLRTKDVIEARNKRDQYFKEILDKDKRLAA